MGKKPAPQKMSLAEVNTKFGGNMAEQQLPSQSVGKDFGKAKGKGLRDIDGGQEANDWRSSGPRKGKGKGDGEPSRADAGDWRGGPREDRGDRGGFGDRGDRGGFGDRGDRGDRGGFGDRGDRGDRGGFGDRGGDRGDRGGGGFRREREDNTQAAKDDDWRGGMGRREDDDRRGSDRGDRGGDRRGFGDRRGSDGPRGGDRGGGTSRADEGNWRSGGGGGGGGDRGGDRGGDSERPRLNLKPRSKPVAEGGEASRIDEEESRDTEERKPQPAALGSGGGGRYIPPGQRRAMEEESRDTEERKPQPAALGSGGGGGGGKYIPPGQRKAMEEEAKRKEEREREADERRRENEERRHRQAEQERQREEEKERKREELRSRQREEQDRKHREEEAKNQKKREEEAKKVEAEKQRKLELKAAKEAEAKERREALKSASQAQKKSSQNAGKKQVFDSSKITSFVETCAEVVKEDGNVNKLVNEVDDLLTEDEWTTVLPIARLNEMLLQHCRGKQDEEVFDIVKSWAPMLNCLIEKSGIRRFKVKVLIEAQKVASKMGLPRLSPASALLEAFFDGLYRAEVIEEDYFEMWAVADDDTAGKTSAMFQVTAFLDWIRGIELANDDQEGEGEEEEDEEDDEEVEEDEIEANVPVSRRK